MPRLVDRRDGRLRGNDWQEDFPGCYTTVTALNTDLEYIRLKESSLRSRL
jgi:hypothetical protein